MGKFMEKKDCRKIELEQNGMQIVLEFPRKLKQGQPKGEEYKKMREPKEEECIEKEVKQILADILQEYWAITE